MITFPRFQPQLLIFKILNPQSIKMKLSTRIYLSAILLLPSLFTGCIKEDVSDCPAGLKVYFTYEPATYARMGVDPSEVDRIDLFLFDDGGIYRGVWTDEMPQLAPGYFMELPVQKEGGYRFIAWCDLHDCYTTSPTGFIIGQTTFAEAMLRLDHLSGEIAGGVPPLFHADKTELLFNTREQKVSMPLVQAYNTINLTTEGLEHNSDTYRLSITDNNGKYKFDHSFADDSNFTYSIPCGKDNKGQLSTTLNILKLAADRHPIFEIYNVTQGRVLYRADLVTLLNGIGNIDYQRMHTYDIHIKFTTDMKAIVIVNGWQVTEDDVMLY